MHAGLVLYLDMSLRLHETSHHSEAGIQLSSVGSGGHARNDGVIGSLARSQSIRVGGVQGEVGTTILRVENTLNST